jgi:hypothetical protein
MKPWTPYHPPGPDRPPGTVDRLLYSRPSNTLVVVMAHGLQRCPAAQRIYCRRLPDTNYLPIGVRDEVEFESQQDAHCCDGAPFLIFNEMHIKKFEPDPVPGWVEAAFHGNKLPHQSERWWCDWLGIRRVNLETGEDVRVLDKESLHPPPPYTSGWVSDILSVSADGSEAVCTVELMRGGEMTYFVFEVSPAGGLKRQVAELPDVFL